MMTFESANQKPVTDNEGHWTIKIPAYHTLHIQIWDSNKIEGVVWGALNLFFRPGTNTNILLDDINDHCIFTGENAEVHNAQIAFPLKIENFHGRMFDMEMQKAANSARDAEHHGARTQYVAQRISRPSS